MAKIVLEPIGEPIEKVVDKSAAAGNAAMMAGLNAAVAARRAEVRAGWGAQYAKRVHDDGRLTTWERLERLRDPGTAILPIGTLVNYGLTFGEKKQTSPGAGVVTCFVRVAGRLTVVIANDNTVASGSWWPLTPEKIQRAQEFALRLRVPVIYLVDCSGLFLPEQARTFPGKTGAGAIFRMNSLLSGAGVPQIAGVMGDCIAGGGYMPIISDVVYMTERAYMVIAGAALVKGGKAQKITSLSIGGPDVHVHLSACADHRVPDDETCIAQIRSDMARLSGSAVEYYRHGTTPEPPRFPPAEIDAIFHQDHRMPYDVRQVIARLVDSSLFWEVLPLVGREMICGVARLGGLYAGVVANNQLLTEHPDRAHAQRPGGILYKEGIAKISAFSRACDDDGLPIIWLQDLSGFDIGVEAEKQGLLGYGSSLIYTNSTNSTPMITVLLRKASGAGYYAMAGLPYAPVLQLSTPITRLAVMEGRTLAIGAYRTKLDDDFNVAATDPAERKRIRKEMDEVEARITADMDPVIAARQMDTDEVVTMAELRDYLVAVIEMAYQTHGYRRIKNSRIWSLHDLRVLAP
ncbi:MAG TPA: carboxyl transferase domain-containing protein [Candidatus Polarisedimenticolia bacterium]|nr:carboxyl transferase domain-containing protein [Candidatus Polarisedimenticolia bacterium]